MQQQIIESTRYVVLLPVQFFAFVVKLPFVLLSLVCSTIKQAVCALFSVPIACICNVTKRAQLLWDSVRCLPRPCAQGTRCITAAAAAEASANQDLDLSAVPRTFPTLGLKEGHERVGLAVRSATKRRPAIWKASLNLDVTDPERLGQSRIDLGKPTREVLLSYLVRLLLQPSTPSDTDEDEEGEQPEHRALSYVPIDFKDPESEKALNLILDLLRLSQSYVYADRRKQKGKHGKQKPSLKKSPKHKPQEVLEAMAPQVSSDEDSSQDQASSRCDSPIDKPLSNDEDERESLPAPKRHSLIDSIPILSPLNESPEQSCASTSSLAESSPQQPSRDSSGLEGSPKTKPDLTEGDQGTKLDTEGSPQKHKAEEQGRVDTPAVETLEQASTGVVCPAEIYSSIVRTPSSGLAGHTNEAELDSIPHLSPALGLKEGHDRRDLAGILRRRPPSKGAASPDLGPAATTNEEVEAQASPDVKPHPAVAPPTTTRLASPGNINGAKKSFALAPNDQPPWMEMIQRRKRSDSGSAASSEEHHAIRTHPQPHPHTPPQPHTHTPPQPHPHTPPQLHPHTPPQPHPQPHVSDDGIYDTLQTVHGKTNPPRFWYTLGPLAQQDIAICTSPLIWPLDMNRRSRSGSASSVPETEAVHRSNSEERHRAGSGEQRWKLMGKKERGERATSPKASKKGKTKKELASGASPALIPASSQLSVSSVPGGNDDALVLANPASHQSKEWEKSQSTSRLDLSRKSQ
ncbi:hypothetical protein EMCRGX_G033804 [Ephydatia muelleri]